MATKVETEPGPLRMVLNVLVIPMFWHLRRYREQRGYNAFTQDVGVMSFFQIFRTMVPAAIAGAGFVNADQRLFAVGGGFLVGALIDDIISAFSIIDIFKKQS